MNWLVVTAAVLLAVPLLFMAWLHLFGNTPVYQRHSAMTAFEDALRQLADLMAEGSVYIIKHEGSSRFLQFRKLAQDVNFELPDAPWSHEHFDGVLAAFHRAGVPAAIVPTGHPPATRILQVRLSGAPQDLARDGVRVASIAAAALGLPENAPLRGHYEGWFDSAVYLARYGPGYEQLAREAPWPIRSIIRRHLRSLRRDAGADSPPPAA